MTASATTCLALGEKENGMAWQIASTCIYVNCTFANSTALLMPRLGFMLEIQFSGWSEANIYNVSLKTSFVNPPPSLSLWKVLKMDEARCKPDWLTDDQLKAILCTLNLDWATEQYTDLFLHSLLICLIKNLQNACLLYESHFKNYLEESLKFIWTIRPNSIPWQNILLTVSSTQLKVETSSATK